MTTSHRHGCEHPGCHEVGTLRFGDRLGQIWRYLCAAHADKEETNDE